MNIPWYRKVIYLILTPFIIFGWSLFHPKEVWEEAKKEWKKNK